MASHDIISDTTNIIMFLWLFAWPWHERIGDCVYSGTSGSSAQAEQPTGRSHTSYMQQLISLISMTLSSMWSAVFDSLSWLQQGQVLSPLRGSGKSQVQIQAGQRMDWEQPWGEGLAGAGWPEAQHDLATCTCSLKDQQYPELHQKKCDQQGKGGESPPLLCSGETSPRVLCSALGAPA